MSIDTLWVLLCACLVMFMRAGFTCLETGMVRAKNSINVALKNLIDFAISVPLFALFGFGLMFGASFHGLVGTSGFLLDHAASAGTLAFFFFQAMFCGTATTIVSGAVAERMRFMGYAYTATILSALIYPVVGHWVWASGVDGGQAGWLKRIGFYDFAGSTAVHSVGGWVSLAVLIVIGPRIGRFGPRGRPFEGHNLALSTLGVFILWFGWFGFNGGSEMLFNDKVPLVMVNTALAGAAGAVTCMLVTWRLQGAPDAGEIMNGVLGGLVAVTAGCALFQPLAGIAVGILGGLASMAGTRLLEKWKIDDAVGAIPVHLFGGVTGTLVVPLFAPDGSFGEGVGRLHQFGVQLLGVAAVGVYAFGMGLLAMLLVGGRARLRVSPREERVGLNISEHGATTSFLELISQMDRQASTGDFRQPVKIENETEASQIAEFYNAVLEKFNLETDRRKMAMQHLADLANLDALTGLANRRLFFERVRRALGRVPVAPAPHGALLYLDLDGFKRINDGLGHETGDKFLRTIARRIAGSLRESDLVGRLGGDEFAILVEDLQDAEADARMLAEKLLAKLRDPVAIDGHELRAGVSIGIALFGDSAETSVKSLVRDADHAMYLSKIAGKGTYRFFHDDNRDFAPQVS